MKHAPLVVSATVIGLLGGGAAISGLFLAGPLLRDRITEEARARGVALAFTDVHFWGFAVSLRGVRFGLVGMPGVAGTARTVDVGLQGWDPRRIEATGVDVAVTGSAADLAVALASWTEATPPTATVTLARTELSRLAGPLGIPLPAPSVQVSGRADLTLGRASTAGRAVEGTMTIDLEGFLPPHPVELDGFLFGSRTSFATRFMIDAAARRVALSATRVRAGAFDLVGGGAIDRLPDHAALRMSLSGNLPCSAVAESAASAHVGSFLGSLLGEAARRVVEGSVAVKVAITADSRNLAGARVDPTVGVGCGLAPLRGIDPKVIARLPGRVLDLARALPDPTSVLPEGFPFPGLTPAK